MRMGKEMNHKDFYCIPRWCNAHPSLHFDGMGGCWGIQGGDVIEKGEDYCKECEFYNKWIKSE